MKNSTINKAFTLAEVLIALVVIGIVAAITVPNIIQMTQKKELEVAFKKQYSALKQAISKIKQEDYKEFVYDEYGGHLKERLTPQYIVTNNCSDSNSECKPTKILTIYKTLHGNSMGIHALLDDGSFITSDGATFFIEQGSQAASFAGYIISIDVNGYQKKPNTMGKDLFMFQITKDGNVLPMGDKNTLYYSSRVSKCKKNSSGETCAYYAVTDKNYFKKI
jgi:prepilin-type N-terminal cleavage/methylation domain-containing protein